MDVHQIYDRKNLKFAAKVLNSFQNPLQDPRECMAPLRQFSVENRPMFDEFFAELGEVESLEAHFDAEIRKFPNSLTRKVIIRTKSIEILNSHRHLLREIETLSRLLNKLPATLPETSDFSIVPLEIGRSFSIDGPQLPPFVQSEYYEHFVTELRNLYRDPSAAIIERINRIISQNHLDLETLSEYLHSTITQQKQIQKNLELRIPIAKTVAQQSENSRYDTQKTLELHQHFFEQKSEASSPQQSNQIIAFEIDGPKGSKVKVKCTEMIPRVAVLSSTQFRTWKKNIDNNTLLSLRSLEIRSTDELTKTARFIDIKAKIQLLNTNIVLNSNVFIRGSSMAVLFVFTCEGDDFTIVIQRPRLPAGFEAVPELPAGMMAGEEIMSKDLSVLCDRTGINIERHHLVNLTEHVFGDGVVPSIHSDERISLFLCQSDFTRSKLRALQQHCQTNNGTGNTKEWNIRVIPLSDLWQEAPDAKALSAFVLYHQLRDLGCLLRFPKVSVDVKESRTNQTA
eukprot:c10071_g1_i1.p1 GENE.c10071_g1_i1~~c10071_g1_i1.p1  ORF type:complete len:511 (+),score=133.95 c10071_g1_i1:1032-2564(+)